MKEIETSKRYTRELLGTSFLRSISSLCTCSARAFSLGVGDESIRHDGPQDSRETRKISAGSRRTMRRIRIVGSTNKAWRIWAKSLGEKVGSDGEADIVAMIRTFWWLVHIFTCFMIIVHNGRNLGWW